MPAAPASPPPLLLTSGLTLSRGGRPLFEGLALRLEPGDVLVVEGPNGIGKSSLLLTLAGVLHPDAGSVTAGDEEGPALHFLGYGSGVKTRLTVRENLRFWQSVYGATGIDLLPALQQVGLGHAADLDAGVLSAGQTRRLGLARLLVTHRPLWLLDEPSAALDAAGTRLVAAMIDAHAQGGGAVVVATHERLPLAVSHRTLVMGEHT